MIQTQCEREWMEAVIDRLDEIVEAIEKLAAAIKGTEEPKP